MQSLEWNDRPPRPKMVLRVGITGHRPDILSAIDESSLAHRCTLVLQRIIELSSHANPGRHSREDETAVRVISPLAEGADRIFAKAGRDAGLELQCIFPFEASEYENDFSSAESKAEFCDLTRSATAVLQLDGQRNEQSQAYETLGRLLVENSDLLVSIWNGRPAAGSGGTAEVIKNALSAGLPVLWLKIDADQTLSLLESDATGEANEIQGHQVWNRIEDWLRRPMLEDDTLSAYDQYLAERSGSVGRKVVAEVELWTHTFRNWKNIDRLFSSRLLAQLAPHFGWADKLAIKYAFRYRLASSLVYVLGALATSLALVGLIAGHAHAEAAIVGELILIVLILVITSYSSYARWHRRWLDYRILAEELRPLRFIWMLGSSLSAGRPPAHIAQPVENWPALHARRIARDLGLASVLNKSEQNQDIANWLVKVEIAEQRSFHQRTARRLHSRNRALHLTGTVLFLLSATTCAAHLLHVESIQNWLMYFSATLPAFGAAALAIRHHGEYLRIAHRSESMAQAMSDIAIRIESKSTAIKKKDLCIFAYELSRVMREEAVDWHAFIRDRPLGLPS